MNFFNTLNFTSANEDGNTELLALCSTPPQRMVCLTGSGARVLDMLLGDPKGIIALDINPAQNHLLRLKIAAYKALDDTDLLAFLGITDCPDRLVLYRRVSEHLPSESTVFWTPKLQQIEAGIWYAGLWERMLRTGAFATRLLRRSNIDRLFATQTLEAQAVFWRDKFDDFWWRGSIRLLGRRWFWTYIIGEPGGDFLPKPQQVEMRLAGAFARAANSQFFRNSDFASLILRGRHIPDDALPLHMAGANIDIVRQRLERIRIIDGGLTDMARHNIVEVDSFSLSDFGSYCSQENYDACWRSILAAARPNARFCEREFMNPVRTLLPDIHINRALSEQLTSLDSAFIYQIRAGTLK
jgi:S-adenosylmethionine-diacylglycerol 3-amino-3-carboxypropyl transferase